MSIRCDGDLTQSGTGAPLCDGSWILEPDVLTQLYELLNAAFSAPDAVEVVGAFMAAFSVPMIAYLAAWAYSKTISFVDHDDSRS